MRPSALFWTRIGLPILAVLLLPLGLAHSARAGSVVGSFNVTNTGPSEADFVFVTTELLSAEEFSRFLATSVSLSLLDADGNGSATLGNSGGEPIFQALIDGVPVLDLLGSPTTLSCAIAGCLDSVSLGPLSGPLEPGMADSISVSLRFSLSSGDSATGLGRFQIAAPEPGAALLLFSSLLGLALCRLRAL